MGFPELETERLRLRCWRESDLDAFHAFFRDPISKSLFGPDVSREDVWRRIALIVGHFHLRGYGLWALEDKTGGGFAGYCGLWFPEGWDDVEVGYGIAAGHRGKGLATEAARCARDFGFRSLRLPRLVSYILPGNRASIGVARKLGAKPKGTFMMKDKLHDVYVHINTDQQEK